MGRRAPESLVVNQFPTVLAIRSFQRPSTHLFAMSLIALLQQRFSLARVRSINPVVYPPGRTTSGIGSPFLLHILYVLVTLWFTSTWCDSFFTCANARRHGATMRTPRQFLLDSQQHPDLWRLPLQHQFQNQRGIGTIMHLSPRSVGAALRRVYSPKRLPSPPDRLY